MRSFRLRRPLVVGAVFTIAAGFMAVQPVDAGPVVPTYALTIIAGTGSPDTPTPGPATSSSIGWSTGVDVDSAGNVYSADPYNNLIYKVTPGGTLSIVAGNGLNAPPTPGPATSSALYTPKDVAVDAAGNLYIADKDNQRIEKITTDGTLSVFAGNGTFAAPSPGTATDSPFGQPVSIAVDSSGNVYVADQFSKQIVKITAGGTLSILAGNGTSGDATPGPATETALWSPSGVAVDSSGNIYFADNQRILKVTTDGALSIVAGNGGWSDPTPGPATSSAFSWLLGVDVDSSGNLYAADFNFIEKITPDGTLSVIAGTGAYSAPVAGPAVSSPLNGIYSVAVDSSGGIVAGSYDSSVIIKLTNANAVAPSAPTSLSATAGVQSTTVSFTPGSNGGSAITKYQYKVGNGPWVDAAQSSSPITVTGLTNYTSPQIRLRAVNAVGAGKQSAPVSARPRNQGPVLDTVDVASDTSVHVAFTGIAFGGVNVSGYTAYAYTSGTDTVVATCRVNKNGRACDIKGLTAGTRYDVRVINYFKFIGSPAPRETVPSNTVSVTTTGGCQWCDD